MASSRRTNISMIKMNFQLRHSYQEIIYKSESLAEEITLLAKMHAISDFGNICCDKSSWKDRKRFRLLKCPIKKNPN